MSEIQGLLIAIAIIKNHERANSLGGGSGNQIVKAVLKNLIAKIEYIEKSRNFTDWGLGVSQASSVIRDYLLECLDCQCDELKFKIDGIKTANPEIFKQKEILLSGILESVKNLKDPTEVPEELKDKAIGYYSYLCDLSDLTKWPRQGD